MAKTQTRLWDASEHLKNEEDMVAYRGAQGMDGDASHGMIGAIPTPLHCREHLDSEPYSCTGLGPLT